MPAVEAEAQAVVAQHPVHRPVGRLEPVHRAVADETLAVARAVAHHVGRIGKDEVHRVGWPAARGCQFRGENVWLLRKRWGIPTVKINGIAANPALWPDGSYSVQGAATALGVTPQTVFKYLRRERLTGRQLVKGQPWQIGLSDDEIATLRAGSARRRRSKKEAS
ncbi:hypothetical protein [Aurantimonas sp. VKM B-3413]|uniref:hypothetical protein n=1 Tax=Aurantimonas sp. VKM B-3413 TaxID=2779401 RepID=UPI001E298B7D|nr:hypothetical protein [Aurantimonas sp. VKM B-3413]MCB8839415.1 hypothetical protein [Aurantimonas sp. VKM B-3413]